MTTVPMRMPLAICSILAATSAVAVAKPNPPACGAKVLPFAVGNTWTFTNVASPVPGNPALEKMSPSPARQVVVTVTAVETKDKDTVISLEEKITREVTIPGIGGKSETKKSDERTIKTTVTCGVKKFEIDPQSFLFAGDPGGFIGMEFTKVERPKGSIVLTNGTIGDAEFREDIIATWNRKPTEGTKARAASGKLELERAFTPQPSELIVTTAGSWTAEKLGFLTTGRVTLDQAHPDNKPAPIPAGWSTNMWLVDGVGLVQVINGYSHMYQLASYAPK